MIRLFTALTLSLGISNAMAGAAAGGATEITQIANNIEMAANVAENARQTSVQMNQLYTSLQNIQNYGNLGALESKLGLPPGSLSQAAESAGSIKRLRGTVDALQSDSVSLQAKAEFLTKAYKAAMATYEKTGVPPSEMIEQVRNMKGERAKYYRDMAENIQKQNDEAIKNLNGISRQAKSVPTITGNVKGLQFLATQNVEIQRSLKENSIAIRQAMQQEALNKSAAIEDGIEEEKQKAALQQAEKNRFYRTTAIGPEAWKRAMGGN